MVRDYAKKNFSRKRKSRKSSQHLGLYLFIALLLALFFTGLYYKKSQTQSAHPSLVKHSTKHVNTITKPSEVVAPVFEFYTLLPKVKNQLNKPVTSSTPNKSAPANYFLQVAALNSQADADTLKAKLLLLGFDVLIKTFHSQGKTWYRVNIGPYTTLPALHADQNRLRENHVLN